MLHENGCVLDASRLLCCFRFCRACSYNWREGNLSHGFVAPFSNSSSSSSKQKL